MSFNVGFRGYLGWMPSYLSIERHIDVKALGYAASIPYLAGFVGLVVFGWLGSHSLYKYRAQMVAIGYLLGAFSLFCTFSAHTVAFSLLGLSFAAMFLYGGFAPIMVGYVVHNTHSFTGGGSVHDDRAGCFCGLLFDVGPTTEYSRSGFQTRSC